MEKVALLLACISVVGLASAAGSKECRGSVECVGKEKADTVMCFSHPDSVAFITGDKRIELRVMGAGGNPDYYYTFAREFAGDSAEDVVREGNSGLDFTIPFVDHRKKSESRRSKNSFEIGGWGIGFVGAVGGPDNLNINRGSSAEIFFDRLLGYRVRPWRGKTSFSTGVGIRWRNYRMTGGNRFVKEDGKLSIASYESGSDIKFSRLKMFSLTLPVFYHQEFGRGFELTLGPVVNFNVHGSMKTKYKMNGETRSYSDSNIHQKKVTVDLTGNLSWREIGVYVKYSPMNQLDTEFGPEFKHLSVGMTFFY